MRGSKKWVGIRQVAMEANVSPMTVSRVLREPDKVGKDTAKRVRAAIRKLGYVPDATANAFASGRSRTVAAIVSTLSGSIFASTIDGLTVTLREAGYHLLLATTNYTPDVEADFIAAVLARRPDGLVLTSTRHTPSAERLLRNAGVPVVELWELPEKPVRHAVGFSNRDAGRAMTRTLIASGRKRIGFIGRAAPADTRGHMRRAGYEDAMRAARLKPVAATTDRRLAATDPEVGSAGLARLLAEHPDIDAVFCASDGVALGAICHAQRSGRRVPMDLAVAGFGDFDLAGDDGLGLTTVRVPGFAIGARAASLILDDVRESAVVDLGFEVIRRRTA